MKWFVYLILEETKSGESIYCGQTSDPARRWQEHQKKRYSKKCIHCNGKGTLDNANSRLNLDRNEPCSKCKGEGKIPGNRKNKGEMRIIPRAYCFDVGGNKFFDLEFSLPSLSDAVMREKEVKKMLKEEKKALYAAGTNVSCFKC